MFHQTENSHTDLRSPQNIFFYSRKEDFSTECQVSAISFCVVKSNHSWDMLLWNWKHTQCHYTPWPYSHLNLFHDRCSLYIWGIVFLFNPKHAAYVQILNTSKQLTPTWFEHAAFWSGVRRATVAPRSHLEIAGEKNNCNTFNLNFNQCWLTHTLERNKKTKQFMCSDKH